MRPPPSPEPGSLFMPKALSLFSGIGGLCEGVRLAGFDVVGAVEFDKFAADNYRRNFPDVPLFADDIAQFLPEDSPKQRAVHRAQYCPRDRLELLFGGPPCQGYSQIGTRDVDDPRNALYLHVTRIARQLKPRLVLIENVPNLLLMQRGLFKGRIMNALRRAGYDNIGLIVLNAAEFGVPQERKRVFFLAAQSSDIAMPMQDALDAAVESLRTERVTVREAIGDLPEQVAPDSGIAMAYPSVRKPSSYLREMRLDYDGRVLSKEEKLGFYRRRFAKRQLHNHHTKEIQEKRLRLIRLLRPGLKADSLPRDVWDNARPEKWRRLAPDRPAHTLMAQMHRDLSEWVHPDHDRWITVREALRLQSFHDGFVLEGSEWQQLKQVGNAVPPLLGRVAAMAAAYALRYRDNRPAPFPRGGQVSLFDTVGASA